MEFIRKKYLQITDWISEKTHFPNALKLFSKLFYLILLLFTLHLYPLIDLLWSSDSLILGVYLEDGLINNFFLKLTYVKSLGSTVYWIHIVALTLALFGLLGRLPKIVIYLTGYMMFYGAPTAFNGGYVLALNYAFILIFYSNGKKEPINIITDNLTWLGLVIQLILVYLNSALFKWTGSTWLEGDSIWFAAHWEVYFNKGMAEFIKSSPIIAIILNYLALAYQSLFPFLIWIKRIKVPFLLIGVLFHGFILFFMNLPFFGSMMILGYILLLEKRSESLLNKSGFSLLKRI